MNWNGLIKKRSILLRTDSGSMIDNFCQLYLLDLLALVLLHLTHLVALSKSHAIEERSVSVNSLNCPSLIAGGRKENGELGELKMRTTYKSIIVIALVSSMALTVIPGDGHVRLISAQEGPFVYTGNLTVYANGPYEVWGGYEKCPNIGCDPYSPEIGYSDPARFGYVFLGQASSTSSFVGNYRYYVVGTRSQFELDSIQLPDGNFLSGDLWMAWGNLHRPFRFYENGTLIGDIYDYFYPYGPGHAPYIYGPPDGLTDEVGIPLGQEPCCPVPFHGCVAVTYPLPELEIIDAAMISRDELGIGIRVKFPEDSPEGLPTYVRFWATINGKYIEKDFSITESAPGKEWGTGSTVDAKGHVLCSTPLRINLTQEAVDRFTENERFELVGVVFCEGGPPSEESIKEVEIFLPVIVLHGYLYTHTALGWLLQPITREMGYGGFVSFLEDNGYEDASDAWYKTLWGPDELTYQGDKETVFTIALKVDSWINAALDRTYANRVNIVGHSLGGLIARYYSGTSYGENKVNKVIMIGTPNAGATLFYKLAFDKNSEAEAEMILKVPPLYEENNILWWLAPAYQALYDSTGQPIAHPFETTFSPTSNPKVKYFSIFSAENPTPYQLIVAENDGWYRVIGETTRPGDGTVLPQSTMTPAYNMGVPAVESHAFLCKDPFIKQTVLHILGNKASQSLSIDNTATAWYTALANPSQIILHIVSIDTKVKKTDFALSWPGSDLDLILYDPNGREISPEVAATDPDIDFIEGNTYEQYTVLNPASGDWTMEIRAIDVPEGGEECIAIAHLMSTEPALVVRGLDSRIYYRIYDSFSESWGNWSDLPGATCDNPASGVCGNELHIVVRGSDSYTLWHGYVNLTDNTFNGWTMLDGYTPSAPTLTSNGTALYLTVRGGDDRIYYRTYSLDPRGWGDWNVVPTGATCDTPATGMLGNDLHIVVRGMDESSLWDTIVSCDGTVVRGWSLLSGATPSKPVLARSGPDSLCLVVRGMDDAVYYRSYTNSTDSWGSWSVLPTGATNDGPGATVMGNMLCTVVRGMDGNTLWCADVDLETSSFSGWTLLDGATPSAPTLTS